MIRQLLRVFAATAAVAAGAAGIYVWRRRDALRTAWDTHGVQVTHADGTPRGDTTGAPYGLGSDVRSPAGVSGNARTAPPPWEPAVLTMLANWHPKPPSNSLTRSLAIVWASPMTLAGLMVGFSGGGRPQVRNGILLFAEVGGPAEQFLTRRGFSAATWGHVVLCRSANPSDRLMQHELVHTRQAERLGPLMPLVYLGLMPVYGYSRHPMERAARMPAPHNANTAHNR